ncbi:MAG: hypothetical protein J7L46_00665 [Bacteroidales bacterium]|nr:hypothetical protein [Bacteroidales bacterium]
MMTILMGLFFMAAIINVADAQQKTTEEKAQYQTAEMTKSLVLTKDQSTQVNAIVLKYAEKIDAVRQNSELEAEAKQDQVNDLRQEREQALKTVFTADQFKKYQELKPQWIQKNRENRKLQQQKAVGQENR